MNKREITNQKLDQLFRDVLEQPPIINEEQVNSLLYGLPKAHKGSQAKQFLKKHQNLWIMSTIISSIIVGTVLWTGSHSQNDNLLKKDTDRQTMAVPSVKTQIDPAGNNTVKLNSLASPEDNIFPALLTQAGFESTKDSLPTLASLPPIPHKNVNVSKDKVIHLSLDDFKKLGFVFTDSSVSYTNLTKDSVWSNYTAIGHWHENRTSISHYNIMPNKEILRVTKASTNDYYPRCYILHEAENIANIAFGIKKGQTCISYSDSLIPITLDVKVEQIYFNPTSKRADFNPTLSRKQSALLAQVVFWFNLTPKLYSLLPDSAKETAIGLYNLALSRDFWAHQENNKVSEDANAEVLSSITNALVLSKEELTKLGFTFRDSVLEYRFVIQDTNSMSPISPTYIRYHNINNRVSGIGIFDDYELGRDIDTVVKFNRFSYYPEIISDIKGKPVVNWGIKRNSQSIKGTSTRHLGGVFNKLSDRVNYLIPVLVKLNQNQPADKDLYFWFTPTDEFFAALPERYAKEIRNDYNIIKIKQDPNVTKEQKAQLTSSCKYFEECKTTLFDVNFSVWPNPTNDAINFELKLKAPEQLSITVQSITGSRLLSLQPLMRFEAGNHTLNFSLASLKPGIYLVTVQNEKGELSTQRIIKE